jgi:hypothetical protein
MSWETRGDHGPYYTRSTKRGGRIVREYVGCGDVAVIIAQADALKWEERQAQLAERQEKRAQDEALEAEIDEFCRLVEAAARAALLAAGYHPHKGQWRRRREQNDT